MRGSTVEQPVLSCSGFGAANRENIAGEVDGDGGAEWMISAVREQLRTCCSTMRVSTLRSVITHPDSDGPLGNFLPPTPFEEHPRTELSRSKHSSPIATSWA
jgi:hypothetical protein